MTDIIQQFIICDYHRRKPMGSHAQVLQENLNASVDLLSTPKSGGKKCQNV